VDTTNILFVCGGAFVGLEKNHREARGPPVAGLSYRCDADYTAAAEYRVARARATGRFDPLWLEFRNLLAACPLPV